MWSGHGKGMMYNPRDITATVPNNITLIVKLAITIKHKNSRYEIHYKKTQRCSHKYKHNFTHDLH